MSGIIGVILYRVRDPLLLGQPRGWQGQVTATVRSSRRRRSLASDCEHLLRDPLPVSSHRRQSVDEAPDLRGGSKLAFAFDHFGKPTPTAFNLLPRLLQPGLSALCTNAT